MVFHQRLRRPLAVLCAALLAGCATAPAAIPTPLPTATPRPTPTAACRYALGVGSLLDDLDEIVSAGDGPGDTVGATHVRLFVSKGRPRLDSDLSAETSVTRWAARGAFDAAKELAQAWITQDSAREARAAYAAKLAKARDAVRAACGQ